MCQRVHPHRPQPPSPQLRRAAGRAKPLPPSPRPRRLLPRLRRNACHPRLPRPPRCSLRRSRSPFAFTRNLTDLSLACEALLPTHWRTCVVTGASGKQVTAASLPGQGSCTRGSRGCGGGRCRRGRGCAGGRCCRGRGERVRGGVASGASEPPAALCAACTLARAKKICHPQGGYFLSFSSLFGRVFLTLLRSYLVYRFGVFARAAAAASRPVACWGCYLGGLPTLWIVCRPQKTACGAFEWCNRGVQKCDIGDIKIPDVPGHLGSRFQSRRLKAVPRATPAKTACFLEHHADRAARLMIAVNWDFGAPVTQAGGPLSSELGSMYPICSP